MRKLFSYFKKTPDIKHDIKIVQKLAPVPPTGH